MLDLRRRQFITLLSGAAAAVLLAGVGWLVIAVLVDVARPAAAAPVRRSKRYRHCYRIRRRLQRSSQLPRRQNAATG